MSRSIHGYVVTEKEFQAQVVKLAQLQGWKVYHTWGAIHSPAGFPDLVLVRGNDALFVELKLDKGKLMPAQEDWLNALRYIETVNAFCWRPCHWDMIEAALKGGPR